MIAIAMTQPDHCGGAAECRCPGGLPGGECWSLAVGKAAGHPSPGCGWAQYRILQEQASERGMSLRWSCSRRLKEACGMLAPPRALSFKKVAEIAGREAGG